MKKLLLYIFIIFYTPSNILADDFWSENYKEAYTAALKLDFKKSDSLLVVENSSNLVCESYIKAHSYFTKYYLNFYDDSEFEKSDSISFYLDIIEDNEIDNPWFYYIKAEMQSMNSILYASKKSNFKSVLNIYRSNKTLRKKIKEFPDFEGFKNLYGMQLCAFSAIPEDYRSVASFFGIEGDVKQGINLLKESSYSNNEDASFMHDKFKFSLAFCQLEFNNEKTSISESISSFKEYPFLIYYEANNLHRNGKIEKAIKLMLESENSWSKNFNYLNYYTGRLLSFKLDPRANDYLFKFLKRSNNEKFKAATYKYLAYNSKISNNIHSYNLYLEKLNKLNYPKLTDSDKAAIDEVNIIKDNRLIKSYLLYDGGYYKKALKIMKTIDAESICTNIDECITYNYRLASIHNQQKNYDAAIDYYNSCVEYRYQPKLHYQANSLVMLAQIYFDAEDYELALRYVDACLELEEYPFKYPISTKAKGLKKRIEGKL